MIGAALSSLRRLSPAGSAKHLRSQIEWPPIDWRVAENHDWPPDALLEGDLDWVRRTGAGYVADLDGQRLLLFHRDWFGWPDPAEWGLASLDLGARAWSFFPDFDILPADWRLPEQPLA